MKKSKIKDNIKEKEFNKVLRQFTRLVQDTHKFCRKTLPQLIDLIDVVEGYEPHKKRRVK